MILIGQYDSPFVRRVGIALRLYGIDFTHQRWSVWGDAEKIATHNPLRRVPTLVLDDGTALVETFAILDTLDERVGRERALLPASGPERRAALRMMALAGGLADKAVSALYETLFRSEPSETWLARCKQQIEETFALLEADYSRISSEYWLGGPTPSHVDIACATSLRFVRDAHPTLLTADAFPRLNQLLQACEKLPVFREIYQPIENNLSKPSGAAATPELELVIIDKNDSSWSMRPWLVLAHFGIPFRETSLVYADAETPVKLAELSPTGKVPLLRFGDQWLWETTSIIEALAEAFPKLAIWPRDPRARRHARSIAAEMHAGFAELRRHCTMNLALRLPHTELDPARRRELDRFERMVENARAEAPLPGPFLFGEFSAADAMLAPVATRIVSYGLDVGPVTRAWVDAIYALPAFQRWSSDAEIERRTRPAAQSNGVPLAGELSQRIPEGPCYAVIFANQGASESSDYDASGEKMEALARTMPGYLDHVSARGADGFGITVSYWSSLDAIANFRKHADHARAQQAGRARYYASYDLRVARVQKHRTFTRSG